MKKLLLAMGLMALFTVLTAVQTGYSYCYNALTGITPEGAISITAGADSSSLSALTNFSLTPYLYPAFGPASRTDFWFLLSGTYLNFTFRYDLVGNNMGIVGATIDGTSISPLYHLFYETDIFALEANVSVKVPFIDTAGNISFSGVFAPVWKPVKDLLCVFVEVDPGYSLNTNIGFSLKVIPGVSLSFGGVQGLTLAVPINNLTTTNITTGISFYYWLALSTKPPAPEVKGTNK